MKKLRWILIALVIFLSFGLIREGISFVDRSRQPRVDSYYIGVVTTGTYDSVVEVNAFDENFKNIKTFRIDSIGNISDFARADGEFFYFKKSDIDDYNIFKTDKKDVPNVIRLSKNNLNQSFINFYEPYFYVGKEKIYSLDYDKSRRKTILKTYRDKDIIVYDKGNSKVEEDSDKCKVDDLALNKNTGNPEEESEIEATESEEDISSNKSSKIKNLNPEGEKVSCTNRGEFYRGAKVEEFDYKIVDIFERGEEVFYYIDRGDRLELFNYTRSKSLGYVDVGYENLISLVNSDASTNPDASTNNEVYILGKTANDDSGIGRFFIISQNLDTGKTEMLAFKGDMLVGDYLFNKAYYINEKIVLHEDTTLVNFKDKKNLVYMDLKTKKLEDLKVEDYPESISVKDNRLFTVHKDRLRLYDKDLGLLEDKKLDIKGSDKRKSSYILVR